MKVEQFVMAYKIEQDKIRAMLPKNFAIVCLPGNFQKMMRRVRAPKKMFPDTLESRSIDYPHVELNARMQYK